MPEQPVSPLSEVAMLKVTAVTTMLKALGYPEDIEEAVMNLMVQHELGIH